MARKELVVCDNCEAVKDEDKQWWLLHVEKLSPAETQIGDLPSLVLLPSSDNRMPPWSRGDRYDLCGDCPLEVIKRLLAGQAALRNQL